MADTLAGVAAFAQRYTDFSYENALRAGGPLHLTIKRPGLVKTFASENGDIPGTLMSFESADKIQRIYLSGLPVMVILLIPAYRIKPLHDFVFFR
jgi:hypothetical protein